jgi:ribosomal protein S27AE
MENQVYFCNYCGEFVFLANFNLDSCPVRPFDSSICVDESQKLIKMNADEGEALLIKRVNGYERREILNCSNCKVPVAYHQNTRFLYVLPEAVSLTKINLQAK